MASEWRSHDPWFLPRGDGVITSDDLVEEREGDVLTSTIEDGDVNSF